MNDRAINEMMGGATDPWNWGECSILTHWHRRVAEIYDDAVLHLKRAKTLTGPQDKGLAQYTPARLNHEAMAGHAFLLVFGGDDDEVPSQIVGRDVYDQFKRDELPANVTVFDIGKLLRADEAAAKTAQERGFAPCAPYMPATKYWAAQAPIWGGDQ